MAITAWPFENADTTETQYSYLFRELQDPGVVGTFGDNALRVTGDSTGMNVKVAAGRAHAQGFMMLSTAQETLTIGAAEASARVDRVVVRFDPTANTGTIVVKQGTAGSSTPPALTQTDTGIFELPLATVAVPAGAVTIAAGDVTDERPYVGHRVGAWTTATRPTAPRKYRLGFNETSGRWEFWTGSAWTDLAPTVTWASITGKPATYPPDAHTHDDRYFTEAEINATLANYYTAAQSDARYHPASTAFIRRLGDADLYLRWDGDNTIVGGYGSEYALAPLNATLGKATAWGGDANAVRYSAGPTSNAYNRNAGNNRFAVYMDDALEWGRNVSSLRYKDAVEPADVDVAAVLALEPVTYHRKADPADVRDLGLIAEDCVDVPHLVAYDVERDEDGQPVPGAEPRPEAVRYETALPVLLLAVVKEQAAQIAALSARLDALEA